MLGMVGTVHGVIGHVCILETDHPAFMTILRDTITTLADGQTPERGRTDRAGIAEECS